MIITCNECESSFNVDDRLIKDTGSKVRCSKCKAVFLAYPEPSVADVDSFAESDGPMLSSDEDLGLGDLDSSRDDFMEAESFGEKLASDEMELDLDNFDDALDEAEAPEPDGLPSAEADELELDLGLDGDSDAELDLGQDDTAADELPDLEGFEDLAGLDDEALTSDEPDADLDAFDFDVEDESAAAAADEEPGLELEDSGDLELEDIGLEDEDVSGLAMESAEDSDDLDLDLDLDTEAEAVAAGEIDFDEADSGDLELEDIGLEDEDVSGLAMESAADSDDLELDLDLDSAAAAAADEGAEEIDLSDLEDILDQEETPLPETQEAAGSEDLELDLDLEMETAEESGAQLAASASESETVDELDLSDLEEIIDSDEVPQPQAPAAEAPEDLSMDLDFQADEVAAAGGAAVDAADELDFSDLEQMLESDETPAVGAGADSSADELDLKFELDDEAAVGAPVAAGDAVDNAAADDEFLDIEKMLDGSADGALPDSSQAADDDLDLPLEMEAALGASASAQDSDIELDFDLDSELKGKEEGIAGAGSHDEQLEANLLAPDDEQLFDDAGASEAAFAGGTQAAGATTDDFATDEFTDAAGMEGQTDVLSTTEDEPLPPPTAFKTTRSRKPVMAVLLLFLLALAVIPVSNSLGIKIPYLSDIHIPYLSDLNFKIPYLSDLINPQAQDIAGNLKVTPLGRTISGTFVNNEKSGQLFVIKGKIKNEYDHPRSFIKVTGKLYQKGQNPIKTSTVYCGNVLSDSELAKLDMGAIQKRLQNSFGTKRSNLKVKTGVEVPFMIVFDKLPTNLEEYTVEAEGSSI